MVVGLVMTLSTLVSVIALEQQRDLGEPAGLAVAHMPGPASAEAQPPERLNDPMPGYIAAILGRPLFELSRRSAAAPPGIAVAVGLPRLAGVIVTSASRRVIFAGASGEKPLIAIEGTRIGPYTVQSIGTGTVTILGPEGVRTLRPSFDTKQAPPVIVPASSGKSVPAYQTEFGPPEHARQPALRHQPTTPFQNSDSLMPSPRVPS